VAGSGGEALFSSAADTNTNAAYMLTVYPDQPGNLAAVQDSDLVALANQIAVYQSQGRTVYLRFAPEMGGNWNVYGVQPTAFKALWVRMYTIVKQIAPATVVLWSPNNSYGYPSGATLASVASAEDRAALDTNGDGELTSADDAFAPYCALLVFDAAQADSEQIRETNTSTGPAYRFTVSPTLPRSQVSSRFMQTRDRASKI
jgi:hypothetical protein